MADERLTKPQTWTAEAMLAYANGLTVMDPRDPEGQRRPDAQQVCDNAADMLRQSAGAITETAIRVASLLAALEAQSIELAAKDAEIARLRGTNAQA